VVGDPGCCWVARGGGMPSILRADAMLSGDGDRLV
jgi:hypothetical protein